MSIFSDNTIEKRVMTVIRTKIVETQKEYDLGIKEIEAETELKKEKLADDLVNKIIGKIL